MTTDIKAILAELSDVEVGKLIKELRTVARRSPEWMADQLAVNARTIHNWESGRNRASVADVIAYETLTGIDVADLLKQLSWWESPTRPNDPEQLPLVWAKAS